MNEKFMTLGEVADLLRIKPRYAAKIWPDWVREGVTPIRFNGNGRKLLFKEKEIRRMINNWPVLKG